MKSMVTWPSMARSEWLRIARPGAHDVGDAGWHHLAARRIEVAERHAARTGLVASQRQACRRDHEAQGEVDRAQGQGRNEDGGVEGAAHGEAGYSRVTRSTSLM